MLVVDPEAADLLAGREFLEPGEECLDVLLRRSEQDVCAGPVVDVERLAGAAQGDATTSTRPQDMNYTGIKRTATPSAEPTVAPARRYSVHATRYFSTYLTNAAPTHKLSSTTEVLVVICRLLQPR